MDGFESLDLSTVCRACALSFPSSVLRDITPPTREMLAFCTGLEIELVSEMPSRLCGTCSSRADDASQFKLQCLRSERELRARVAALHPAASSTPLHSALGCESPAPGCSVRSISSDSVILGCKIEEILDGGALTTLEECNSMSNFMEAILEDRNIDTQKKRMIIEEIINEQPGEMPGSADTSIKFRNIDALISEKQIDWTKHVEDKVISMNRMVNHVAEDHLCHETVCSEHISDINPTRRNDEILQNCRVTLIDFLKLAMPVSDVENSLKDLGLVRCRYCYSSFCKSITLYEHLKTEHPLDCVRDRGEDFIKLAMPEHVLSKELEELNFVRCRFCYNHYSNVSDLYLHLKQRHNSKCRTKLGKIDYVTRAMPERSNMFELATLGFVRCRFCYKPFRKLTKLYRHLKRVHRLECKQSQDGLDCVKRAMPERELIEKLKDGFVKCRFCYLKCLSARRLYLHLKKRHLEKCEKIWMPRVKVNEYICNECGKKFKQKANLIKHLNRHEGEPPHLECTMCERTFPSVASHTAHMRAHTERMGRASLERDERDCCICSICGKIYVNKSNLNKHMLSHESVPALPCSRCARSFRLPRDLARHLRIHEEKTYKCLVCFKMFGRSDHLTKHVRTHTGERPYRCAECGERFAHGALLRAHEQRRHRGGARPPRSREKKEKPIKKITNAMKKSTIEKED